MAPRAVPSRAARVDLPDPGKSADEHETDLSPFEMGLGQGQQRLAFLSGVGVTLLMAKAGHLDSDIRS